MVLFSLISILQQKQEFIFLSPAPTACFYLDRGSIHSVHWQAHEMWEFRAAWGLSCAFYKLAEDSCFLILKVKDSYSQIVVHCSIMQIASYECFPFTRGQTQQPETFGVLVALQGQRANECLLARCDLLMWVRLQLVLYPHISWCSFPQMICNWISHKSQPGEGRDGEMRWLCRLCTCQGADKRQRMVRKKKKLLIYLIEPPQKGIFREWKILESSKNFCKKSK